MEKDLLSEFEENTQEQWLGKIHADLKGKSYESLLWKSEIGTINPIIFTTKNNSSDSFSSKGSNDWNIRQKFDANNKNVNKQIIQALRGGVNAIEIKNISDTNIDSTLLNVMLNIISVHIDINNVEPLKTIQAFIDYCLSKNINLNSLNGGFEYDSIGNLSALGNWLTSEKSDLEIIKEILAVSEKVENFSILNINAATYCDAGANTDTQIAFALAHANEYLNLFEDDKELIKKLINKIQFTFGIGTSYFIEIAKLRAFRSLWSVIVKQYLSENIEINTKIQAINSNLLYSDKDSYNNLLRATTAGMSAAIGGCNSLTILPFNCNTIKNDDFALRISKNIQLILQEESYLNKVVDSAKGSYYIEDLTKQIKDTSWELFLEIEKQGGFMNTLKNDFAQTKIEQNFLKKKSELNNEQKIMIGVNKFINESEKPSEIKEPINNTNQTTIKPINPKRLSNSYEKSF